MEPWKKALQKSRAFLVKNVDIKNSGLWDAAQSEEIITNIQADSIQCNSASNFKQVGAFIDHLLKRPYGDYVKFLKVLRDSEQEHAAEHLENAVQQEPGIQTYSYRGQQNYGGHSGGYSGGYGQAQQPMSGRQGTVAFSGPVGADAQPHGRINEAATGLQNLNMDVHTPVPKVEIMKLKAQLRSIHDIPQQQVISEEHYTSTLKREKCYPIKKQTRGRALVITMTGNRKGWTNDVLALEKMFRYLNVLVEHKFDLTHQAILSELETFAAAEENADVDVLFVVLMSHGGRWNREEFLKTADGRPFIVRDELEKVFSNKKYPALRDKPKIFIVQMCRGVEKEQGQSVSGRLHTDADVMDRTVGSFTDYIFGFATQPGRVAHRDPDDGTWYIQKLADVFIEQAHLRPVSHLFAEVNNLLEVHAANQSQKDSPYQIGESLSGLKAPLFLFPGFQPK